MKKYKLTNESIERFGRTLYRIEALKGFGNVTKGDKGGHIEKEGNLSQDGDAWVYGNAMVYGDARVSGDVKVLSGYCFAYKEKDWNVTEVESGNGVLLIKDYIKPEESKHIIVIDGKKIELSEESFNNLKEQLN